MPGWVEDLLKEMFYGPFYQLAKVVWDWCIGLSTGVISQDPQHFSPATWKFVTDTLYPWAMGIGLSMMNVFFICVFLKAASNLKENITLELCIEGMIRLVALNVLMQMGMQLMKTLFSMASLMGGMVLDFQAPDFFTGEVDAGSVLFWWFMGFLYFFIALICGMLIFLTLFSRYVKLYLLTVTFPLAMPSMVSGRGIDETAKSWVRSFLGNVFEIVVIALVMSISGRIIGGMDLQGDSFADFFDGEYSSEPLGDYFAGPNHVLPTNGTAKFFSPLSVDDFLKKSSIISYSKEALEAVHQDIEQFAKAEQLTAHANSIHVRFEKRD